MAAPALAPPTAHVDPEMAAKYDDELKIAAASALPDEDDDDL